MAKMTAKYRTAHSLALRLKLPVGNNQEELYSNLSKAGHMWDSDQKEWIELTNEEADEPTPLVMVRVWADGEIVEDISDDFQADLQARGYCLVERSQAYRCRPPKQLEARVYLKFMPPKKARRPKK